MDSERLLLTIESKQVWQHPFQLQSWQGVVLFILQVSSKVDSLASHLCRERGLRLTTCLFKPEPLLCCSRLVYSP